MVTVETPASFQWNDTNSHWVKNYLMPKSDLLVTLTNGVDLSLNQITEDKFTQLCQLLETTAEGRELRNKMFKAWRSKKSRDSDNGKKLYTFNLSIKAGEQLKKVAKQAPLNQTLEALIFAGKINSGNDQKLQQQLTQCKLENERLQQQLTNALQKTQTINDDAEIESLIKSDLQVTELAKLEKSKLIKQILMLKRKN
ncbi:hypothetical protein [uncultured Psychromonas sp.]|uniref:hypothetical protein n=1 Tax=uncultured Psychromonas sp. TaxID=173974 RepID=UPI002623858C|nr:hypothetical protein [uncultured Psychromonas sp.]